MASLAKAISSGSLRGARGNSGVILSQLFRGFTKVIAEYDELTVQILSDAFQKGTETAYKAVMKPKEGTILTVAKGMSDKAAELGEETDDLAYFCEEIIKEGDHVLSKTPDMLPVLKQAGVVDSGGQGLMQVLKGAFDALMGKEVDYKVETVSTGSSSQGTASNPYIDAQAEQEITFTYCTQFLIMLEHPFTENQETEFKSYLESIGDSIVVVADDEIVKVHVHTNDPGMAMQRGLTYGSLTTIIIENMRLERDEKISAMKEKEMQNTANAENEIRAAEENEQEVPEEWLKQVYVSESFFAENDKMLAGYTYEIVSDSVFKAVSDTQTPHGILCLVRKPQYRLEELLKGADTHLLILESIQDPGNLGTMLRTGEGAGISGVVMNHTTVDLFNPKTIRSTMGSIYRMPFFVTRDLAETICELKNAGVKTYAAHLKGKMQYDEPDYTGATAFMIGNEGNGLSDEIADLADTYIKIPMCGQVESLNAAISASLLMYETNRQRRIISMSQDRMSNIRKVEE